MKRLNTAALCVAAALVTTSAAAQTPAAPLSAATPDPTVVVGYAGLGGGIAAASTTGGAVNGEAGARVWKQVDVSVEVGWFSNVLTRKRTNAAATLTNFLAQTQGQAASATVKVPAFYGTVNGRWVFEKRQYFHFRPYALVGVGVGRVSPSTKFTLNGTNITGSVGQYGLTLGKDLSGHSVAGVFTGGFGAVRTYGKWYVDGGYRLTSLVASGGSTVANRLNVGAGMRF